MDMIPIHLGGPETICHIDESIFMDKIKAQKGRALQEQV